MSEANKPVGLTREELIALAKVTDTTLIAEAPMAQLARAFLEAEQTIGYLRTKQLGYYDGTALGELKAENARLRAWREGTLAERDAALALAGERLAERDILRLQVADYEKALRSECSCSGESGYNPPFDPILCDGCEALARYNKEKP